MTSSTQIKLSPAMVTALMGAEVVGDSAFVTSDTKAQTVKGLESRGLTTGSLLTAEGVEAARQLGNDLTTYNQPATVVEEPVADWERELLGAETSAPAPDSVLREITPEMVDEAAQSLLKAVDLDAPHVVPNRKDKRKGRFQIKGALSRLKERQRVKRMNKYGSVPETLAA